MYTSRSRLELCRLLERDELELFEVRDDFVDLASEGSMSTAMTSIGDSSSISGSGSGSGTKTGGGCGGSGGVTSTTLGAGSGSYSDRTEAGGGGGGGGGGTMVVMRLLTVTAPLLGGSK